MSDRYTPTHHITPGILRRVEEIGGALGNLRTHFDSATVPVLRRGNRIKTVQASLEIEGNTLSLKQVTAVLADKRVLGRHRELQEAPRYQRPSNRPSNRP
jgi:Fic family protein